MEPKLSDSLIMMRQGLVNTFDLIDNGRMLLPQIANGEILTGGHWSVFGGATYPEERPGDDQRYRLQAERRAQAYAILDLQ